jgi:hypothetical protein
VTGFRARFAEGEEEEMTMRRLYPSVTGVVVALASACGDGGSSPPDGALGSLQAAVSVSDVAHDVTAVQFDIVSPGELGCEGTPLLTETVNLEDEALPASLAGSGTHAAADGLFVLPPGTYLVCATPLAGDGPSTECARAEASAEVAAGITTEVVLDSQCGSDQSGGLDAVLSLNDQPQITALELEPSKFITICESATITATAADANEDTLSYAWSIVDGPEGASLRADGATATFSGAAGDYTLALEVDDGHGGQASVEFPVHVSDAVCEVPEEVQAIFDARCSPCHTTGSSGGLHLNPASASFANLVEVGSSSSSCSTRTRVIPGEPADSYLIAKLRGAAGICGLPMPRNLPALPEEEIGTIEAWIAALPH